VLDLPLSSSFTSLHDLFHSTAFVVARNAANACRATAKRSDAALTPRRGPSRCSTTGSQSCRKPSRAPPSP